MPSIDYSGDELEAFCVMDVTRGEVVQPLVLDSSQARSLARKHRAKTGSRVVVRRFYWRQKWDECRFGAIVGRV